MPFANRLLACALVIAALAGTALAQGYPPPPRPCGPSMPCRHRLPPPPAAGPAEIVSGYLPRNTNVPMYNEPPSRPARY